MKDITILLTCCNGLISPSQIKCLRSVKERRINIVGVDMNELGVGSRKVDIFYKVPPPKSASHINKIFDICKNNNVDFIIPASEEESLSLVVNKEKFHKINTKIITNTREVLEKSIDKGNFLKYIKQKGLPCARFMIPKNIDEFEKACHKLGYPKEPVATKPRLGSGNRGFRIIQNKTKKGDLLLNHKPGTPYTTLKDIKEALTSEEVTTFPGIVLMEYLPGQDYSVDILAKNGDALIIVPKKRIVAVPGLSIVGQVDLNQEVINSARSICKAFSFNYNVNIQFRFSKDNKLYPYEANTRAAGSIAACQAAGANLFYYGIKLALGEDIPKASIKNGTRMMRYYKEYYE
jgi:carbamoyl-phosphate synthase large subunit